MKRKEFKVDTDPQTLAKAIEEYKRVHNTGEIDLMRLEAIIKRLNKDKKKKKGKK